MVVSQIDPMSWIVGRLGRTIGFGFGMLSEIHSLGGSVHALGQPLGTHWLLIIPSYVLVLPFKNSKCTDGAFIFSFAHHFLSPTVLFHFDFNFSPWYRWYQVFLSREASHSQHSCKGSILPEQPVPATLFQFYCVQLLLKTHN